MVWDQEEFQTTLGGRHDAGGANMVCAMGLVAARRTWGSARDAAVRRQHHGWGKELLRGRAELAVFLDI